ncbi:MAG TPA: protein kinase [Gemmatimonadaceae bacterium]|nr:protein kinase [Gemmatimonadaceae bacterium]
MSDAFDRLRTALADRYRLERELGAGGMATVYLAEDIRHGREVAIKVLHPDLGAALGAERFLAEIKTTARLQHPHILPLLDSGEAGGSLFYVMPFVAGETLRARLVRERQLPVDDALRIAREVGDALGAAHAIGIVHRDIKPENILLQSGHALVADFGIALAVHEAAGARMTQTGLSLGTPQYMSPEQAMGEKAIDARADLYALGAVTYEMLTGEPPFTGATLQAIVAKVVSATPEAPSLVRRAIPPHVEAAVLRALEKLPADRFSSAADFTAALEGGGAASSGTNVTPSRVATPPSVVHAAPARRWLVAWGVVAAAALAVGWWMGRRGEAAPSVAAVSASLLLPDSMRIQPQLATAEGTATLALSPDGTLLAFAGSHGTRSRLFLRPLTQFAVRGLEGTEGAQAPFFSASGESIYFFALEGVKRVALADGRVTLIHPPPAGSFEGEAWGGTAMSDGTIVLSQRLASELLVLSPSGDSIRTIACRATCAFPAAMPDGRHVLATSGDFLFLVDIETGEARPVTRRSAAAKDEGVRAMMARVDGDGHLIFARDGRLYAAPIDAASARLTGAAVVVVDSVRTESGRGAAQFAINGGGTLVYAPGDVMTRGILVRADRAGKLDTIPAPADEYTALDLTPDGRRVVARVGVPGDAKLVVIDVATGRVLPWIAGGSLGAPRWTADGRRVAFVRNDSGFIGDPEANASPLPLPGGTAILSVVTPLSDSAAFLSQLGDSVGVLVHGQTVGSRLPVPSSAILAATGDGRWVIAQHLRGEDNGAIVAYAMDGSGRRAVIAPGSFGMPAWVAGGSEVIAAEVLIARAPAAAGGTRQTFYAMRYDPTQASPFGAPQQLFTAAVADFPGRNFAVGGAGRRFVFKQHIATAPLREVRVLTAWHDRLRDEGGARAR